jgi:sugar transferase EpsL
MYRRCGKRVLDVCIALLALVLLSPLAVAVSLVVRVFIGSPVLFRQRRPGFNGDLFELVKFRTIFDARDSEGVLLPDADRLRAVGLALRRLSLDEVPQLWNVLGGEMSLVGPGRYWSNTLRSTPRSRCGGIVAGRVPPGLPR